MVSDPELDGFRRDHYFSRSWALLTRDRGWIKPVLVMTVALLVPIVGVLGVLGYALEWARLTAWNVNAAPKQRGVDVGGCIKSGWRGFLVMLVWGILSAIVVGVATVLPIVGALVSLVWFFVSFFFAVVVMVAALRATIYQRFGAGMRASTIWQMVSHDPGGLLRVVGINVIGGALAGVVTMFVVMVGLAGAVPHLVWYLTYLYDFGTVMSDSAGAMLALQLLASVLASLGPALVVVLLVDGLVGTILLMVSYTAVALWMRQFDVSNWGRDEDPLPPFVTDPRDDAPVPGPGAQGQAAPQEEPVEHPQIMAVPGEPREPRPEDVAGEVPVAEKDDPVVPEDPVSAEKGDSAADDEGPVTEERH